MRIDVYHHSVEARCEVMRRLDALDNKIDLSMETIMATLEELNAALGAISPLLEKISADTDNLLDQLANILVKTGTKVQHISNNAPFGLADFGTPEADARRKAGVAMAKRWLEGCAVLGVKSMRMNSPQALGPSIRPNAIPRSGDGYPRNL